jgi:hypothetical protein
MPERCNAGLPLPADLREITGTLSDQPDRRDEIANRLRTVAELLATAGPLPAQPLLLWRESPATVRHHPVGEELVVGRKPGEAGLALAADQALSRRHFLVRETANEFHVIDLNSHNGTAVNGARLLVRERLLHDGDIIVAGSHVFAFLDQRRTR